VTWTFSDGELLSSGGEDDQTAAWAELRAAVAAAKEGR